MKIFAIPALAIALFTGGCASTGGGTTADSVIAQVQATAQSICSFIPTAATVSAILNQTGASASIAIAEQICAAVVRRSGSRISVRVNGQSIPVTGRFVSRR